MNQNELNEIQQICKIDLQRRQLYTTTEYSSKTHILYFPTTEGNVFPILNETQLTIQQYHDILNEIPNCILAIISKDTSVVYYGIEPSFISFKED